MLSSIKLYFDLAIGVLILGLVVFAGWQYDQAKLARKDTEAANAAMTQLHQGLEQLQAGQQASNDSINTMVARLDAASTHAGTVARRVVTMGNSDANVQKWLDTPLPAGGCMLDDTCSGGAAASAPQRGVAASVPASGNGAVRH